MRKFIQLLPTNDGLVALCDDGSVFKRVNGYEEWQSIGNAPQDEQETVVKKEVKKTTKPKTVKKEPVEETKESKTYAHDDLKQACLASSRADSKNRDKLKALLKKYDAVKAVDVPTDKLEEVIGKIESGDF